VGERDRRQRISRLISTNEEAVAAGREQAKQDKTEHVIHTQHGVITGPLRFSE
jgi:Uncharacterized protein conserved in bacteria (DUF2188)